MLSFTRTSSAIKQYLKIVEAATVVCILGDTQQDGRGIGRLSLREKLARGAATGRVVPVAAW
jgi:hypothetical protein